MSRKKKNKNQNQNQNVPVATNGWDVLKTLVDGVFNLVSLSKAAAIGFLWFVIRDMIFVFNLPEGYDYAAHLLNSEFLEYLMKDDNKIILAMVCLIGFLIVACFALIGYCVFLRHEINRMAEVRSQAIHSNEKIKEHSSSDIENKE